MELRQSEPSPLEKIENLTQALEVLEGVERSNEKKEIGLGCEYEHSFTNGIYVRKMRIPKDLVIVTAVHKTQHPYFIMYGDVSVFSEDGMVRLVGPYSGITEPGTQRALRTHEDTLWITIHATDKTDIESIMKDIAVDSMKEYKRLQED